MSDFHTRALNLGVLAFISLAMVVPELAAQQAQQAAAVADAPLSASDVQAIETRLKAPAAIQSGRTSLAAAVQTALARAMATRVSEALEAARQAHFDGKYHDARALARAVVHELDGQTGPEAAQSRGKALLLLARSELDLNDHQAALRHLNMIPRDTPVDDFVLWLKGDAQFKLGQFAEAADTYQALVRKDTVLKPRAQVARARALYQAQDFEKAARELAAVNRQFTLHPQRHELLYEQGFALESLGKKAEAADVYQDAWFEFPFHAAGADAQARLVALRAENIVPKRVLTPNELFDRYVRLRIDKHWDVVHTLFSELLAQHATPDGNSGFERQIQFQLAVNDWGRRHFQDALTRLLGLADDHERGHTEGVSKSQVWRYIRMCYSQLGQLDQALAALEIENERESLRKRLLERAELLEDHGRYEDALQIYAAITSPSKRKGWHYTWLLYKTGHVEEAYTNFTTMAARSSGEKRARNLYWAARTLENDGRNAEAAEIFEQVRNGWPSSYYGIQSANRILDIQQRGTLNRTLLADAIEVSTEADRALDALEVAEAAMVQVSWDGLEDPRMTLRGQDGLPASVVATSVTPAQPSSEPQPELALAAMQRVLGAPLTLSGITGTEDIEERDGDSWNDASAPIDPLNVPKQKLAKRSTSRVGYTTSGRIYWDGRLGSSTAFARWRDGELIGPVPQQSVAYDDPSFEGGLNRAAQNAGNLFPNLVRAEWLWMAGMEKQARWLVRDVAIEFRELSRRYRPSSKPHALENGRWNYYIDNRRKNRTGIWGWDTDEKRYPVPTDTAQQKALLTRQQAIHDQRNQLRDHLIDGFKEVGEHFMTRKYTTEKGGWYRQNPLGPARNMWMQAYPRAFPNIVLREAHKNGVNPYLLWALMTVESSYNPDSLSHAQALGLLQVIPKTGLKTALMLGDEDFGPQDLLDEEVAIAHGAFYFGQLLRKFHGQELLAFAGYNGGPHRVGDWLDSRGNQPLDEFIEEIPYDEARGYAKKVSRFVALFLKLYEGRDTLYIGQNLRYDYRPEPRF